MALEDDSFWEDSEQKGFNFDDDEVSNILFFHWNSFLRVEAIFRVIKLNYIIRTHIKLKFYIIHNKFKTNQQNNICNIILRLRYYQKLVVYGNIKINSLWHYQFNAHVLKSVHHFYYM